MTLTEATDHIHRCLKNMAERFGAFVFDEWAIVLLGDSRGSVLAYEGPRPDEFRRTFSDDIRPLREAIIDGMHEVGDFEFAHEARGTPFDAFILVAPRCYLLFNHTRLSMAEIRRDPRWIRAQLPFVALSETFQVEPLQAAGCEAGVQPPKPR